MTEIKWLIAMLRTAWENFNVSKKSITPPSSSKAPGGIQTGIDFPSDAEVGQFYFNTSDSSSWIMTDDGSGQGCKQWTKMTDNYYSAERFEIIESTVEKIIDSFWYNENKAEILQYLEVLEDGKYYPQISSIVFEKAENLTVFQLKYAK